MNTGRCPGCRRRMVLVRHRRCECPQPHQPAWQYCPAPKTWLSVRRHDCGANLIPTQVQELPRASERAQA